MKFKKLCAMFIFFSLSVWAQEYKGAELRTKESYLYGRFEVCYRASAGTGHTSTFFTYNDEYPSTPWNEIDIEILGRYSHDVQFNTITPYQTNHVRHQCVDFNPCLNYHIYAFEWTPGYVAWFIDDKEIYRQTDAHIATLNQFQKIMMNIWNPVYSNWVGSFDDQILPRFAYYDYVSYASYAPGSGNTGTDLNFMHQWIDHFNDWDQSRWEKASHTFPGNNCDFTPDNVVFQDGNMILCLTDETHLGYMDKTKPVVFWARAEENKIVIRFSEEIEETSAQNSANYLISGVYIDGAVLLDDRRIVELTVSGMELGETYNLVVMGIYDDASLPNRLTGQVVKIIMPQSLNFPIKINVGGSAFNGFLPDQELSEGVEYGYWDGSPSSVSYNQPIEGTEEDEIYRSQRLGLVTYKVRVQKGNYKITLMISENNFTTTGARVFDIFIEGNEVIHNLDVFQIAGKCSAHEIKFEDIEVTDNCIDIHFCASKAQPILNGIVIEQLNTGLPADTKSSVEQFLLEQNFPNPFNPTTTIPYTLSDNGVVMLNVYDIMGRLVDQLINEYQVIGRYQLTWTALVPSGIYLYRIDFRSKTNNFTKMRRMVLMK